MYVMTSKDKQELEDYRALGTPEEIRNRLNSPYPMAEDGYAPRPQLMPGEKIRRIICTYPPKPDSGLLEDDDFEEV